MRDHRCMICGDVVNRAESIASEYACFVSCIPIIKADHVVNAHGDYVKAARSVGRPITYSAITLIVLFIAAVIYSHQQLAASLGIAIVTSLLIGTVARRRVIAKYRALYSSRRS